jgi:hypothetical protein
MVRYRPRYRYPDRAARPVNLAEAESIAPGLTPAFADPSDMVVDVETPTGETFAIDHPELIRRLRDGLAGEPELAVVRSDRALTDCRPVSLLSMQTVRQLGEEVGAAVDLRRLRENVLVDFGAAAGFAEDGLVGRSVRIGSKAVIAILERDPRCAMITLDPDTGESRPELLRHVAKAHDCYAGVYGAVLVEGMVRKGDAVVVVA